MDPATDCVLAYVTAPTMDEARDLARMLVRRRLASGVNLIPGATSVYWWEDQVQEQGEVLLFAQTTWDRFPEFRQAVQEMHPYEVPCIVALSMSGGHPAYLDWIIKETTPA